MTTTPTWSVLIPTVPRRRHHLFRLIDYLGEQIGDGPVELLALLDNKRRTIGAKRQALLDMARGDWVSYVDDDDWIAEDYISQILAVLRSDKPDLVVFPIVVTINGDDEGVVESSIKYAPRQPLDPLEEYKPGRITKRPPHELSVWKTKIARFSKFPDSNVGEDFDWASRLWGYVGREVSINKKLYHYRFDRSLAECEK